MVSKQAQVIQRWPSSKQLAHRRLAPGPTATTGRKGSKGGINNELMGLGGEVVPSIRSASGVGAIVGMMAHPIHGKTHPSSYLLI